MTTFPNGLVRRSRVGKAIIAQKDPPASASNGYVSLRDFERQRAKSPDGKEMAATLLYIDRLARPQTVR